MLGGLPEEPFRDENTDSTDMDLFFSSNTELARLKPELVGSCTLSMSINADGNMPVFPLELVPVQHQCSWYDPRRSQHARSALA